MHGDENILGEKKYSITDAEWKVMRVLWKLNANSPENKLPLGDILTELTPETAWNMNTVRTLLIRLAEKKIIVMEKSGSKFHKYYAAAKEDDCVIRETKSFVDKFFGGSAYLMFSALLKNGELSAGEQSEILKLIEEGEGKKQ
ncbi:uracil phosphoribosyltransferase [Clostridia bacterium]|nr:uracil phosphoribosyltransferase [Clostridia bacterium]